MDRSEVREKMLVWWEPRQGEKILCRVVQHAERFTALRVLAATPQQVQRIGYGCGETAYVNFDPKLITKAV